MDETAPHELSSATAALIARSADPPAAAAGLHRYWAAAGRAERKALQRDAGLQRALLSILASSEFLAETLIESPELLLWLDSEVRTARPRSREEWPAALAAFAANAAPADRSRSLSRFKRREYLRIALRDLEGQASLAETTQDLSWLADAALQQAYVWAWNDLAPRHGTPQGEGGGSAEMAVIGLGKLGGGELNYSSDIDLMFVYSAEGETAGAERSTSNREFFTRLAQAIVRYMSEAGGAGAPYRVDLRLRPGGREGEMALALSHGLTYYASEARDWELQMLIRARPCAGSAALAQRFLGAVAPRIYPVRANRREIAASVRLTRERISVQLDRHRALGRASGGINLKLDAGGIRDVEFLAQYLQRLHGAAEAWVRHGNTLITLQRLHDKRLLGGSEFQQLSRAYWLLRHLEHRLQLRLGQQTHSLPRQAERLAALARSMRDAEGAPAEAWSGDQLAAAVAASQQEVRRLYARHLGAAEPSAANDDGTVAAIAEAEPAPAWTSKLRLSPHGRRQLTRLWRSAATSPKAEADLRVLPDAAVPHLQVALSASDWMAEALIRRPGLAADLQSATVEPLPAPGDFASGMGLLRRWHQQQTLRLLLREWEARAPIADSLQAHSELAIVILQWALALARSAAPPAPSLSVLALGRLGLGELDLLSDLDLVFVAKDEEREVASRLAAKLIEALSAYTQEGSLYAVDARLRPGGGEGELVQTPASLAAYFHDRANLWEAISYLKARRVAGDKESGGAAIASIAAALARRFRERKQEAAIRRELTDLRDRMEREGHPGRWGLKTPPGGYYDVDFLVSCRWLQRGAASAGGVGLAAWTRQLPAEALPDPVRGELARRTNFLRAADHALRVATGKAGSGVPAGGESVARAWVWLRRIAPAEEAASAEAVDAARARIREIYQQWR